MDEALTDIVHKFFKNDENATLCVLRKIKTAHKVTSRKIKFLGMGEYGIAIQIGNIAIKFSKRRREAVAAHILMKTPILEAYKVYGVYEYGKPRHKIYMIVSEVLFEGKHDYRMTTSKKAENWLDSAMHALDSVGIDHADVHEDNIMKRKNGQHVLIDFGNAKISNAKKVKFDNLLDQ